MLSQKSSVQSAFPNTGNWTKQQLKLAFHYYCQTPFGRLHARNPEIIKLASLINRTPSSLAMKLVNFSSLDPSIINSGRRGLKAASKSDREIWEEFHSNWDELTTDCIKLRQMIEEKVGDTNQIYADENTFDLDDFSGETRKAIVEQRIKQDFFRRAVLSSYQGRCCISGVTDPRFIIASHIVPWCKDKSNRLNPSNGLCLSVIHDKAFDKGLFSLSDELRIALSSDLKNSKDEFLKKIFFSIEGKKIEIPQKFLPGKEFLSYHRNNVFLGV